MKAVFFLVLLPQRYKQAEGSEQMREDSSKRSTYDANAARFNKSANMAVSGRSRAPSQRALRVHRKWQMCRDQHAQQMGIPPVHPRMTPDLMSQIYESLN